MIWKQRDTSVKWKSQSPNPHEQSFLNDQSQNKEQDPSDTQQLWIDSKKQSNKRQVPIIDRKESREWNRETQAGQ
jgi:hypothetical protein